MIDDLFEDVLYDESLFEDEDVVKKSEELDPELFDDTLEPEKMGALEAGMTHAADIVPGLGGLTAGLAGKAGELYSEQVDGSPVAEADAKLKELGIKDPSVQLNHEGEERGTFQQARMGQLDKEKKAFEDQPAASLLGGVAGGALGMGAVTQLAKAGKVGQLASNLGPNVKNLEKLKRLKEFQKRAKMMGHTESLARANTLSGKILRNTALKEGAKFGAMEGLAKTENPFSAEGIENGLIGGSVGAGLGLGITTAGQGVSHLANKFDLFKRLKSGSKFGKQGIPIERARVDSRTSQFARDFAKQFQGLFKKYPKLQKEIMEDLQNGGVKFNNQADMQELYNKLIKSGGYEREQAKDIIGKLAPWMDGGLEYDKALKKISADIKSDIANAPNEFIKTKKRLDLKKINTELDKNKDLIKESETFTKSMNDAEVQYQDVVFVGENGVPFKKRIKTNSKMAKSATKGMTIDDVDVIDLGNGQKQIQYFDAGSGKLYKERINLGIDIQDVDAMDAVQTKTLIDTIDDLIYGTSKQGVKGGEVPSGYYPILKDIKDSLKKKLNEESEKQGLSLDDINKKISFLKGILSRDSGAKVLKKGERFSMLPDEIDNVAGGLEKWVKDSSKFGEISASEHHGIFKLLEGVDPKLIEKWKPKFEEFRELNELVYKTLNDGSSGAPTIHTIGRFGSAAAQVGHTYGSVIRAMRKAGKPATDILNKAGKSVTSNAVKVINKVFLEAPETVVNKIMERAGREGKVEFIRVLNSINMLKSSTPMKRQAILYSLYTNPKYAEFIKWIKSKDVNEEEGADNKSKRITLPTLGD